jgi:hypothetical protein
MKENKNIFSGRGGGKVKVSEMEKKQRKKRNACSYASLQLPHLQADLRLIRVHTQGESAG